MQEKNQIQIYQTDDGQILVDVIVDKETVWLSLNQISNLFDRDKSVISKHIRNVFQEEELQFDSTVAKFATVQIEGDREIKRFIEYYNLDVIISVGYRVKSKRGTQFRIWANKILKDYILRGYSLNEKMLKEKEETLKSLKFSIDLIEKLTQNHLVTEDEVYSLLSVLSKYSRALDLLDGYDHQSLVEKNSLTKDFYNLNYTDAISVIEKLKEKFGGSNLFGREKDNSFLSSISTIYQTYDGEELYPGVELKAVNLLYFLVKNHSFVDGNKRIAASIFLWYLFKNRALFDSDNEKIIDDSALVGITLMIAESNPKDKKLIINVLMNLLIK